MGIVGIYLFIFGCCIGSFVNVVTYRLPLDQSIVYPYSRCPKCKTKINWFDNLPLISWFFLRGKCRSCKTKISFSYPIVELSTGLLAWLNLYANPSIYSQTPVPFTIFCGIILSSILITLAILDFKYFWLPNAITIGGLILGVSCSFIIDLLNELDQFSYLIYSIAGSLLGFSIFYLLSLIGKNIFKKAVMGGGDLKLSALLGAWLGTKGLLISIWLSFNFAGIFVILGLLLKKIKRNQRIPFGVFLSFSGLIVWYFGNEIFVKLIF